MCVISSFGLYFEGAMKRQDDYSRQAMRFDSFANRRLSQSRVREIMPPVQNLIQLFDWIAAAKSNGGLSPSIQYIIEFIANSFIKGDSVFAQILIGNFAA